MFNNSKIYNRCFFFLSRENIMVSKVEKVNEFLELTKKVREKGNLYEEERAYISGRARGFIRGVFDEQREADYIKYINENRPKDISDIAFFDTKCKQMLQFFETLKEEIEAREAFQGAEELSFNKLESNVEKNKIESERRKNVAEFKYWGFAIELIDTVRQELKKFRQTQEELLESINSLRKELKESKENSPNQLNK